MVAEEVSMLVGKESVGVDGMLNEEMEYKSISYFTFILGAWSSGKTAASNANLQCRYNSALKS